MINLPNLFNKYQTEVAIQAYRVLGSLMKEFSTKESPWFVVGETFCDKELHGAMRAILPQMKIFGFTKDRYDHNKNLIEAFCDKMQSVLLSHQQILVEDKLFGTADTFSCNSTVSEFTIN